MKNIESSLTRLERVKIKKELDNLEKLSYLVSKCIKERDHEIKILKMKNQKMMINSVKTDPCIHQNLEQNLPTEFSEVEENLEKMEEKYSETQNSAIFVLQNEPIKTQKKIQKINKILIRIS